MIVTCVSVRVRPDRVEDFIRATSENHAGSVREPGNLRFDVLQSRDDPTRFLLYEAYESEDAAAEHKRQAHYLTWRDAVADWMAEPRRGDPFRVVCPKDREAW